MGQGWGGRERWGFIPLKRAGTQRPVPPARMLSATWAPRVEYIRRHPELTRAELCRDLGITEGTLRKFLGRKGLVLGDIRPPLDPRRVARRRAELRRRRRQRRRHQQEQADHE